MVNVAGPILFIMVVVGIDDCELLGGQLTTQVKVSVLPLFTKEVLLYVMAIEGPQVEPGGVQVKLGDTHSTKTCFTKLTTGQLGDDCTDTVIVLGPHTPNTPTFGMMVELPGISV